MRRIYVLFSFALLFSALLAGAEDFLKAPRFPEVGYFRRHFAERVPHFELRGPERLEEFMVGDRLELSLRSYLELVLANNTDIQIQRLSIEFQQNDITRSFAPFDPTVAVSFQSTRSTTPSDTALAGADTLSQLRQPLRFAYQQTLENGTQYSIGFDGAKNSSNDSFTTFNPALSAGFNFAFTQPLLRNRGAAINRLPILIARTRYQMSNFNLEDQLSRMLEAAEGVYWDVVQARENLRVQQDALQSLNHSLKRSQKELELGEIAPVEIYQPQQVVASEEVLVTEARSQLRQAENALRREIGADLDSRFRDMPIDLSEPLLPAYDEQVIDRELLIQTAYQKRRDMEAAVKGLAVDDMTFEQSKNALLPDVSLVSTYRSSGRGGHSLERSNVFAGDGSASEVVSTTPGGLGDAIGQLLHFGFPTYSIALNVAFPVRDRKGAADLADAAVSKRLDTLRLRALQQQIRQEVLDAAARVEASQLGVKLAQTSVDFARKRVEAEQRKYELGATTIFFLLDAQNSQTRAQSSLVLQSAQYRHNLANLLRVTGKLAEERGVIAASANTPGGHERKVIAESKPTAVSVPAPTAQAPSSQTTQPEIKSTTQILARKTAPTPRAFSPTLPAQSWERPSGQAAEPAEMLGPKPAPAIGPPANSGPNNTSSSTGTTGNPRSFNPSTNTATSATPNTGSNTQILARNTAPPPRAFSPTLPAQSWERPSGQAAEPAEMLGPKPGPATAPPANSGPNNSSSSALKEPPIELASRREREREGNHAPLPQLSVPNDKATFELRGNAKDIFTQVAGRFDVSVIFDQEFVPQPNVRLSMMDADFRAVMEALTSMTGTFMVPTSPKTIFVARDTEAKRHELEPNTGSAGNSRSTNSRGSGPGTGPTMRAERQPQSSTSSSSSNPGAAVQQNAPPPARTPERTPIVQPTSSPTTPPLQTPPTAGAAGLAFVPPRPLRQVLPDVKALAPGMMAASPTIEVVVVVDPEGHVSNAQITNGKKISPAIAGAALAVARDWLFAPATLGGKPVQSQHTIVFQFRSNAR